MAPAILRQIRPASFLLLAGMFLLVGCGHPTYYQPATEDGKSYGYTERAVEADKYRLTFSGNTRTARSVVEDYLLYRAAELALQLGYGYFVLVDTDTERKTTTFTTYIDDDYPYSRYGSARYDLLFDGYFDRFGPSYKKSTTRERYRYTAQATVQLRRGEKPADAPDAFEAQAVVQRLGPAIIRPGAD